MTKPEPKTDSLKPIEPQQTGKGQGISIHPKAQGVILPSFICGIFGSPGAGKSTLIEHFLLQRELFHQKFERVLFVGPTIYHQLIQDQENHKKGLDQAWIMGKIKDCNSWKCTSLLIVFDDIVSQLKSSSGKPMIDLFYNRRHLLKNGTINILLTSQKWNMIPPFIRVVLNMIVLFPLAKQQIDVFYRQVNLKIPKRALLALLGDMKRHQFLYFNLELNKCFNSNWVEL